jgi:N-acetylmuramoyl-L-alanine amidase
MKVKKHLLYDDQDKQIRFNKSPNGKGKIGHHEYLVIHFTAGSGMKASENWLTNPDAKASAHLIIGRDGSIVQLVPFDRKAWHAGVSQWANRTGLNSYSIGIELDNAGKLQRQGSKWMTWFGKEVADDEVIIASHKNGGGETGWHAYTEAQMEATMKVSATLMKHYSLLEIVGHDDIAPERKTDPGPAFPMESFKAHILGRGENEEQMTFTTTAVLNIRSGPGTGFPKLVPHGLPKGTPVVVLKNQGNWRFVDISAVVEEENDIQGWVHGRYLSKL